ncbi:hypothetical protein KC19_VG326500 [Ceratodon purpureus]|uniref:Uncharacterized protein n=1 Tax=Ceratodon purpureus TaxID=3225 RepID=A0A8T0HWG4_CERPU|nr:hypothetical protein KC19_VG326000 [Ceratodon purpureus]KAG0575202.1 hypothetical protein KC19_VG326500 [Ceratodon purpureus]
MQSKRCFNGLEHWEKMRVIIQSRGNEEKTGMGEFGNQWESVVVHNLGALPRPLRSLMPMQLHPRLHAALEHSTKCPIQQLRWGGFRSSPRGTLRLLKSPQHHGPAEFLHEAGQGRYSKTTTPEQSN